jgi:aprataxin
MKRRCPPSPSSPTSHIAKKTHASNPLHNPRSGLGAYIRSPEKYDSSRVIYHTPSIVAIHDLYPKSSVHCLLLPRSPTHQLQHPFKAFSDADFLAEMKVEAAKLKKLVAKELQRKYGQFSKIEEPRQDVLNGVVILKEGEEVPEGRDWEKEVMVGIHAHPSMNHLHIHVISRDRFSESMKHRKHYNSFATPFFVELDAFPLEEGDARRFPDREGYLGRDLKCWRCGMGFGNKFARLKEHLAVEFEEWKRE